MHSNDLKPFVCNAQHALYTSVNHYVCLLCDSLYAKHVDDDDDAQKLSKLQHVG
jgi:hypothetical protein